MRSTRYPLARIVETLDGSKADRVAPKIGQTRGSAWRGLALRQHVLRGETGANVAGHGSENEYRDERSGAKRRRPLRYRDVQNVW